MRRQAAQTQREVSLALVTLATLEMESSVQVSNLSWRPQIVVVASIHVHELMYGVATSSADYM